MAFSAIGKPAAMDHEIALADELRGKGKQPVHMVKLQIPATIPDTEEAPKRLQDRVSSLIGEQHMAISDFFEPFQHHYGVNGDF
ncbi:hypothetical protein AY601_2011 [Pedobacter cryoconitis]|uniref:Uncharacterized protein n=1 Tax=Pedobacter cryoconitis TaxID=188932 RepID=A0A127VCH1_9SPHI|nr:hypothetical protein [Pedobacter cryoconitis]AMP98917.1 hypothetical protein AY601_2011 [Pedobacter cryoconitis]